jgi:hypothetical protein
MHGVLHGQYCVQALDNAATSYRKTKTRQLIKLKFGTID